MLDHGLQIPAPVQPPEILQPVNFVEDLAAQLNLQARPFQHQIIPPENRYR